ncbi:hypothetical protein BJF78_10995 [Pseudonocardia sp. CNS-139]|nr:hypothetical protein BJF78_10995 [Pseudonocardia sp. CNS-139]
MTAALCLRRHGIEVDVYEQAPELREAGAGVQISPNAARLLHRLGLGAQLDRVGVWPDALVMRRWDDNSVIVEQPAGKAIEERFGAPYDTLHRADLHPILVDALPRDVIHTGHRLVDVEQNRLVFDNGAHVQASVVIGADELRSVVMGRPRPTSRLLPGPVRDPAQLGAQGAAQAIDDGWVLARCMAALTRPVPERLRLYEELCSRRVAQVQVGSRSTPGFPSVRRCPATATRPASTSTAPDRVIRSSARPSGTVHP